MVKHLVLCFLFIRSFGFGLWARLVFILNSYFLSQHYFAFLPLFLSLSCFFNQEKHNSGMQGTRNYEGPHLTWFLNKIDGNPWTLWKWFWESLLSNDFWPYFCLKWLNFKVDLIGKCKIICDLVVTLIENHWIIIYANLAILATAWVFYWSPGVCLGS